MIGPVFSRGAQGCDLEVNGIGGTAGEALNSKECLDGAGARQGADAGSFTDGERCLTTRCRLSGLRQVSGRYQGTTDVCVLVAGGGLPSMSEGCQEQRFLLFSQRLMSLQRVVSLRAQYFPRLRYLKNHAPRIPEAICPQLARFAAA
jgi:hypothetical protein